MSLCPARCFGEAVDHEVRAVSERLEQEWRAKVESAHERCSHDVGRRPPRPGTSVSPMSGLVITSTTTAPTSGPSAAATSSP